MARNRIFYGLFLLAAVVFHSFYTGWFSFFLLLFSVLLPVFSLLVSLLALLRAAYTPQLPQRTVELRPAAGKIEAQDDQPAVRLLCLADDQLVRLG